MPTDIRLLLAAAVTGRKVRGNLLRRTHLLPRRLSHPSSRAMGASDLNRQFVDSSNKMVRLLNGGSESLLGLSIVEGLNLAILQRCVCWATTRVLPWSTFVSVHKFCVTNLWVWVHWQLFWTLFSAFAFWNPLCGIMACWAMLGTPLMRKHGYTWEWPWRFLHRFKMGFSVTTHYRTFQWDFGWDSSFATAVGAGAFPRPSDSTGRASRLVLTKGRCQLKWRRDQSRSLTGRKALGTRALTHPRTYVQDAGSSPTPCRSPRRGLCSVRRSRRCLCRLCRHGAPRPWEVFLWATDLWFVSVACHHLLSFDFCVNFFCVTSVLVQLN